MFFRILTTSAATAYLNSFQALPYTGQMRVSIVRTEDGDRISIRQEILSSGNVACCLEGLCEMIDRKGSFRADEPETWKVLETEHPQGLSFLQSIRFSNQASDSNSWKEVCLALRGGSTAQFDAQVEVRDVRSSRSAAMMVVTGTNEPKVFGNRFRVELEGLALLALKEYLGLNPEHRLDLVCHALLKGAGVLGDDEVFRPNLTHLFPNPPPYFQSFIKGGGIADFSLADYHLKKDASGGFAEWLSLSLVSNASTTLPPLIRPIWDWVLSEESEPKEEERERYYALTKRIYSPYLR